MSERYIQYAFVMYLSQSAFDALYTEMGETHDYDAMRDELSEGAGGFDTSSALDSASHGGVEADMSGLGSAGGDGGF